MVLIKENGNLIGLFQNKMSDIFLKNTINALGLDVDNLEVYDFTANCMTICKYEQDVDKFYELDVDKLRLKKVIVEAEYDSRTIYPHDSNALDYYTQDFIDHYNANIAAENDYISQNGDSEGFTLPYPQATAEALLFGKILKVPAVIEEDYVFTGTPVDIAAKIAQEESESSTHK